MGKIHDKIKARQERINAVIVPPRLLDHGFAREASILLEDLPRVRADRNLGTAERHYKMQELADKAKRLGLKGRWNLLCNRTQCLRPDATWYNRGSYAFYCCACALDLNHVNRRDAEEFLGEGEKLCIRIDNPEEAGRCHVS